MRDVFNESMGDSLKQHETASAISGARLVGLDPNALDRDSTSLNRSSNGITVTTASIDTARELEVLNCMQAFMVIGVPYTV